MTLKEQIKILKNEECVCGKRKIIKHAFCKSCFSYLGKTLQQDLYRIGDGF